MLRPTVNLTFGLSLAIEQDQEPFLPGGGMGGGGLGSNILFKNQTEILKRK